MMRTLAVSIRDSYASLMGFVLLSFPLRVKALADFDCTSAHSDSARQAVKLEMSRVFDFDPEIRNVQTLVPKNTISYHTSPP